MIWGDYMYKRFFRLKNILILVGIFCASFSASAVVTYQSISSDLFVGKYPGAGGFDGNEDIYWQGGTNDIDIVTNPDGSPIPGSNTIGSSVFSNYTTISSFESNFLFEEIEFSFSSNLVVGANTISDYSSFFEFFDFQDGLVASEQVLSSTLSSTYNVNANNTAEFTIFHQTSGQPGEFIVNANSISGFYLNAGQDPNSVFSDESLFSGLDPFFTFSESEPVEISQQGVIDQFNYLIDDVVDATWQSLSVYYWTSAVTEVATSQVFNIGYTGGSFVSYDAGSIPTTQVPEPSTYMLFSLGLIGLIGFSSKKNKARIS